MNGALWAAAFVSSALTATIGMGGGILLLSVMPGLLPAAALVPVHGVTQVASNATRAATNARHVALPLVAVYAIGAGVGASAGAPLIRLFPASWIPPALGVFILVTLWLPGLRRPGRNVAGGRLPARWQWAVLGAVQTAVSLFVGAAGPLTGPMLLRQRLDRDALVATHAGFMTVMHGLKVLVYGLLGFAFGPYLPLLAGMLVAVLAGTWVGNRLRSHVPEARFRTLFRWGVTLLAVRLILRAVV